LVLGNPYIKKAPLNLVGLKPLKLKERKRNAAAQKYWGPLKFLKGLPKFTPKAPLFGGKSPAK